MQLFHFPVVLHMSLHEYDIAIEFWSTIKFLKFWKIDTQTNSCNYSTKFWPLSWSMTKHKMSCTHGEDRSACPAAHTLVRVHWRWIGKLVAKDQKLLLTYNEDSDERLTRVFVEQAWCWRFCHAPFQLFVATTTFEPPHDTTNKMACAPSKDSDQPGHPPSLIRVFAVHMKKAWVLNYPLSEQQRLWSDWVDAQADLSLCWVHTHFVAFIIVMRHLI